MTMLADIAPVVIGVDTHARTHTLAVVTALGAVRTHQEFATTPTGIRRALAWAGAQVGDGPRVLAIEGTRSYGIGLARAATADRWQVIEVEQPAARSRRGTGKSDPIDAAGAARTALATDTARLGAPRADGIREALRILRAARDQMTTERTTKNNALIALLRSGTPDQHATARTRLTTTTLTTLARTRTRTTETLEARTRRVELTRLAKAILALEADLRTNYTQITDLVDQAAPTLTQAIGIGPISAATILIAYSHPGRIHSEAAFARLAGVAPIPASSGMTTRHRLDRGGDRQLNRALHTITMTRLRIDPTTRAYATRRRADNQTDRDIRRTLKRYIARQIYRTLNNTLNNTLDNT